MAEVAVTTGGSRTFSGGVKITWTPSGTANSVELEIQIGGDDVWQESISGDGTTHINVSGDNYKLTGSLAVTFGGTGKTGEVRASKLEWTVQEEEHSYSGIVGSW